LQPYLASFAVALGASAALTPVVGAVARKRGFVARPRADRWHRRPTALFGGVAIFLAFLAGIAPHWRMTANGDELLVACAAGLFLLGFVDDLAHLRPYTKLVGQIVGSALLTTFGLRLGWLPWPVADQALTIFWLVGITNAVNLLDNLDGLAGGVAAIAAAYLVAIAHAAGQGPAATLAAALCGAVIGFLIYNFNPASIFMGDCGSLFLGFLLGGISLVHGPPGVNGPAGVRGNVVATLAVPLLLLLVPILDTALVTVSRTLHGRPVSQGGRDHTSHRLVALGLSERGAALVVWGLAALSGALAFAVRSLPLSVAVLVVPLFVLFLVYFAVHVGHVKVYQPVEGAGAEARRTLLPTLADFTYKRRAFEVLNDLVVVMVAMGVAFLLHVGEGADQEVYAPLAQALPVVLALQLGGFLAFGLYRASRLGAPLNPRAVLAATAGGWALSAVVLFVSPWPGRMPVDLLLVDGALVMIGVAGSRLVFRAIGTLLGLPARARAVPEAV
jgi:UDP-GlcNAc:undecaprenyl-phosphate GlcNAc-1-phosphate transferase